MRDGMLHFYSARSWPIKPLIGTLGVAPDREVTTSLDTPESFVPKRYLHRRS